MGYNKLKIKNQTNQINKQPREMGCKAILIQLKIIK